jgi:hypothetical protein
MSFLNNLLKGFIRSTVNQVGRDGGRVISNQLYGNAHASPVRVSQSQTSTTTQTIEPQNTDNTPYNFLSMAFADYFIFKIIAYSFFSIIIVLIGSIYTYIRGVEYSKKQTMEIYGIVRTAITTTDKRYRTGTRVTGYRNRKALVAVESADYAHLKYYKTKGKIYKIIAISAIILDFIIYFSME